MTTSKHINFAEVAALAAQAPARVKGVFTFEVSIKHTEASIPEVTKGLTANAKTLKAAIKEAGALVAIYRKAYDPVSIQLYFYFNGVCAGVMTLGKGKNAIRCDFSGLVVNKAIAIWKEETPAEVEEAATETPSTVEEIEEAGMKVIAITKEDSSFNADFVLIENERGIYQAFTVRGLDGKSHINYMSEAFKSVAAALAYLGMTDEELAQNIDFISETAAEKPAEPTHAAPVKKSNYLIAEYNGIAVTIKVSANTMRIGRKAGYHTPADCFRYRAETLPDFDEDADDMRKEMENYSRYSLMCERALQNNGMRTFA